VLEDARAEGKAEGEALGIAKGKAEGKAEIVRTMHASGLGVAQISQFTGLSVQQVAEILTV
jgi:predicted transposase/invertase (TIGR01784 family)